VLPHIELRTIDSQLKNFQDYEGKTILVVNVASHCGFTPQYKDLQALHTELKDQGLAVLGFPCNQFGAQEPGSGAEIVHFCQTRYAVDFELFEKTDVNGANAHPLFVYLKEKAPGILGTEAIKWNFTKFLIDKSGQHITRFGSNDSIEKIRTQLISML
jgi:glutathione peroxidase